MDALGRHILAELHGCDPALLADRSTVESILVSSALRAGAEIREVAFHQFSPQGVSGVVVISESHLAVHTWPEFGYCAVDAFTCGSTVNPITACEYVATALNAGSVEWIEVARGRIPDPHIRKEDRKCRKSSIVKTALGIRFVSRVTPSTVINITEPTPSSRLDNSPSATSSIPPPPS